MLSDYLALRGYIFQRLDGTVPSDARRRSIEHFNAPGSPDFCFILSTRAGGLGINLETADTVVIFDSDWNPQADLQAMARAHRIGQQSHVNVYRFVTKDTVEEDVLERARKKMILEHAIISQVDTSGLNIGKKSKTATAKENYSKEELSDILKYGASSIFKSEANQAQLEEMNLDDVLNKAEDYETDVAPGGTSLGGEEFLRIAVQDVKHDLTSWDDIIPIADRELAIMEKQKADDAQALERKSKIKSMVSTSYQAAAESDDGTESASSSTNQKKSKKSGPKAGKTVAQRAVELNEKDVRLLVRGIQKFGDIRYRYDKIVQDAKLERKNRSIVQQTSDEIIKACKAALAEHEEELKVIQAAGGDTKKQKAVIITVAGASGINAETTVGRYEYLQILNESQWLA